MSNTNEVLKVIYERRSVRAYADRPVSEETIREIIKAGCHAPNGGNAQGLRFAIVTNRDKLKAYAEKGRVMSLAAFQKMNREQPSDKSSHMIKMLSNPDYNIFFDAPATVFVFASPNCITPVEDASLAAGNMMLAAKSMGLGSCWVGFGKALGHDPEFMKELNIPPDHQLVAPMILGYPKKEDLRQSVRDEPKVLCWLK